MRATCPAHIIFLDLIALVIFTDTYILYTKEQKGIEKGRHELYVTDFIT
jgi:hypothetical protein